MTDMDKFVIEAGVIIFVFFIVPGYCILVERHKRINRGR